MSAAQRHRQMMESLRANDIHHWYGTFCSDLEQVATMPRSTRVKVRLGSQPPPVPAGWWQRTMKKLFSSRAS